MKQLYCQQCEKFLADRFVYGDCPYSKIKNHEAHGDQCEECNRLLDGTQLVNPKCGICKEMERPIDVATPLIERESQHIFIKLPGLQV